MRLRGCDCKEACCERDCCCCCCEADHCRLSFACLCLGICKGEMVNRSGRVYALLSFLLLSKALVFVLQLEFAQWNKRRERGGQPPLQYSLAPCLLAHFLHFFARYGSCTVKTFDEPYGV